MCKIYAESMRVWTQLTEDTKLQELGKKLQMMQDKAQKFKEVIPTLPPAEMMTMQWQKIGKLYSEMNQMRVQQQAHAQKIEALQEEVFRIAGELVVVQGVARKATQENEEKLKTHITTELAEEILQQETQVKEKVETTKETFQKFMTTWKQA
jgi:hypothetical protein